MSVVKKASAGLSDLTKTDKQEMEEGEKERTFPQITQSALPYPLQLLSQTTVTSYEQGAGDVIQKVTNDRYEGAEVGYNLHTHTYTYTHAHTCTRTHIHTCTHTHTHTHTHMHTHTHTHATHTASHVITLS